MKITVETLVAAPLQTVWDSWTTPEDIMAWNAASDDWHTTAARVDLREGGEFSSRMEARDGSMGFDFAGVYTVVAPLSRLEARFGDREMIVEFIQTAEGVRIREAFDSDGEYPEDMQRQGWQAILDRFKAHTEAKAAR